MFYVSRSGENVLDNVMQGVAHEGLKTFFILPQFSTHFERKAHAWIWKHEVFVIVPSNEVLPT